MLVDICVVNIARDTDTLQQSAVLLYISAASTRITAGSEVSECFRPNSGGQYCFHTSGSELSWDEAEEFCERRNSTLPIINEENIDRVFRRFIVNHSCSVIQSRPVWLGARARRVDAAVKWRWIDGRPSGKQQRISNKFVRPRWPYDMRPSAPAEKYIRDAGP